MKLTPRRLLVYIIAIYAILSLISCTKSDFSCGMVVGGRVEFNDAIRGYIFYLRVEYPDVTINERVDQKTYESYFVGDAICLY